MSNTSPPHQANVKTEFDAACVDVFRSPMRRALLTVPGHDLLPRFTQQYHQLLALPRRARRSLQRQWKRTLAGVALLLALTPGVSFAATMNVAAGVAPEVKVDGKCSLIEAIVNANNNAKTQPDCPAGSGTDTINLPANSKQTLTRSFTTLTLPPFSYTYNVGLPQIKSPIVIEGRGSSIDRAEDAPLNLVLYVAGTGNLTLNETTISGRPPSANYRDNVSGCINNDGTLLMTKGALVRSYMSYPAYAPALFNKGTATLRQTSVNYNEGGYGGVSGIVNWGRLTLTSSTVSHNSAYFAGGIFNSGTAVIDNSAISGNGTFSNDDGQFGGIGNYGTLTISNSTISGNSADYGAALRNSGTANIVRTTISGNTGGFYTLSDGIRNDAGSLTLTNSTVSGNETGDGAIRVYGGTVTLTHTTVTGNSGADSGGISVSGGTLKLEHSVVSGNIAWDYTTDSYVQSEVVVHSTGGTVIANNFNLFGHTGKSGVRGFTRGPTDIVPSQPLSGILMPLASNGGANQTHALAINSPALNAAPVDATCKSIDQRGNPRPQGVKCDIGSFEGSAVLCNGLVTTQVGTVNADTLTGTAGVDVIAGLNGNDTIRGLNGNDVICAGSGADKVYGGNNNDRLFGDSENDQLYGDAGNDALNGGTGTDKCVGGTGTDTATQCETRISVP